MHNILKVSLSTSHKFSKHSCVNKKKSNYQVTYKENFIVVLQNVMNILLKNNFIKKVIIKIYLYFRDITVYI